MGVLVYTVVWTVVVGRGSTDLALTASLLGLLVSALSIVVALIQMAVAARPDLSMEGLKSAADNLASSVNTLESEQRTRWLGGDVIPIDVEFFDAPGFGRRPANAAATGTLETVHSYYRDLVPRRLLITGAGGSGKTVLAVELLLLMLADREPGGPVPVRFSLSDWDVGDSLGTWLSRRISSDFRVQFSVARKLVETGLVVPILDGLDEMSSQGANRTARAVTAVTSINEFRLGREGAPLVITSREDLVDDLAASHGVQILDVERVIVQPLTASQVASYLERRFRHHADKWRGVLDRLAAEPQGVLAQALSTPWRLTLASTAYSQNAAQTPDELMSESTDDGIGSHLMARYLEVVTRIHPRTNGRTYQSRRVITWLGNMAVHLNRAGSSDIRPHELWNLSGRRASLVAESIIISVPTASLAYLACVILKLPVSTWILVPAYAVGALIAYDVADHGTREPQYISWRRLLHRQGARAVLLMAAAVFTLLFAGELFIFHIFKIYPFSVGIDRQPYDLLASLALQGLLAAAFTPLAYAKLFADGSDFDGTDPMMQIKGELQGNIGAGLVAGAYLGLFVKLPHDFPHVLASASGRLREDRVRNLNSHKMFSGAAAWIDEKASEFIEKWAIPHFSRIPEGFPARWPAIVAWTMLAGIVFAFLSTHPSRRYMAMRIVSWSALPLRLSSFFSWSYHAGLLRKSGGAFQFRHRELQEWFADQVRPHA
ncbi:NACHT domain-containing protein [Streptomyces sp. NPDC058964]|uniref:NACHT domain-containing protein n=1 Tax=Streptomyces sp. NPDC058964 TaxID=3346681 RepID=UPI0036AFE8B3